MSYLRFIIPIALLVINVCCGLESSPGHLNVAFLTDVHIGEGCNGDLTYDGCKPVRALTEAVNKINSLGNIDAVFISGDLTSSALYEEFQTMRDILTPLNVPWWPLLGNHDSWPYTRHSDGTFNQTDSPIGDQYFAEIFGDILSASPTENADKYENVVTRSWPTSTCQNGYNQTLRSWFHNFEVYFPEFTSQLRFISLDWVARSNALPEPGVGPEVELHEFECGTYTWLQSQLDLIRREDDSANIFIVQHHPFHNRQILDPFGQNVIFNFTFDDRQNKQVQGILSSYFPVEAYLGSHAGHMHRWFNGSAFTKFTSLSEEWLVMPAYETPASKGWWIDENFIGSFQVIDFESRADENGSRQAVKISDVRGYWIDPSTNEWAMKPPVHNIF